jgi:hypothetical protein
MNWKLSNHQHRLYILALVILAVGLVSAVIIYFTAGEVPENVLVSETEDFKKYVRSLELYGGKANVLAVEFMNWFNGLWRGKSLAYTIGVITIIVSCGIFFVAYHMGPGSKPGQDDKRS